jgi:hypothetical protein
MIHLNFNHSQNMCVCVLYCIETYEPAILVDIEVKEETCEEYYWTKD